MRWIRAIGHVFGELLLVAVGVIVLMLIFKYANWTVPLFLVGGLVWSIVVEARKNKP